MTTRALRFRKPITHLSFIIWFVAAVASCAQGVFQPESRAQVPPFSAIALPARADNPKLRVQLTHAKFISAMAVSEDARLLATASFDNTIRLWDVDSGRQLRVLSLEPSVTSRALAFAPDRQWLISGGDDGAIRLWDVTSGGSNLILGRHDAAVTALAINQTGAVTGDDSGRLKIWTLTPYGFKLAHEYKFEFPIVSLCFTSRSKLLVASGVDVTRFDTDRGRIEEVIQEHEGGLTSLAIGDQGNHAMSGSLDGSARLWSIGRVHGTQVIEPDFGAVRSVALSGDGSMAALGSGGGDVVVWDLSQGRRVAEILASDESPWPEKTERYSAVVAARFAGSDKLLLFAKGTRVYAWHVGVDTSPRIFQGHSAWSSSASFAPDGTRLAIGSWDKSTSIWDLASGFRTHWLTGQRDHVRTVKFSSDGSLLISGSRDGSASLWDVESGKMLNRIEHVPQSDSDEGVRPVDIARDDDTILTGGDDGTVKIWRRSNGLDKPLETLSRLEDKPVWAAVFADPQASRVLAASGGTLRLWSWRENRVEKEIKSHENPIVQIRIRKQGDLAVTASWDRTAALWSLPDLHRVAVLTGHSDGVLAAAFSPDGKTVATASQDGSVRLWDAETGASEGVLGRHEGGVLGVEFSPDGNFVITVGEDQTARLWRLNERKLLCTLVSFDDGRWAVVDPDGRFDASDGGDVDGLHWVIGTEAIALYQLKERYYEPGLLAKLLGENPEPVREVRAFVDPGLYPELKVLPIAANNPAVRINLHNRGGGIGRVVVSINGKEITADARTAGTDPNQSDIDLAVPIGGHPYLIPGQDNIIEVRVFNQEGYLSSRGVSRVYRPPAEAELQIPTLWGVVAGVSDYDGDRIDLGFAAKDAEDFGTALGLAARRLFGEEHVRIRVFTTNAAIADDRPTKRNLVDAFASLAKARPWDIIVVFLAGHGVGRDDHYYFLTQEARSAALSDPSVRARSAIASSELVEWLKRSPALKQAMVLDTCAAGAVARDVTERRELGSSAIRAIERIKDRTGFHVLMGSAADAFSYETSQFDQGLLTYALLEGMKGAALGGEDLVQVSDLFQYAVDEVPLLARHIGGIQRPRIAAPRADPFPIGQLTREDRQRIRLAAAKPMLLRPYLMDQHKLIDTLDLTARLRDRLAESRRGTEDRFSVAAVYLDVDDYPDAIRPSGLYRVDGEEVEVRIALARNHKVAAEVDVRGSMNNLDDLADRLVRAITARLAGMPATSGTGQ